MHQSIDRTKKSNSTSCSNTRLQGSIHSNWMGVSCMFNVNKLLTFLLYPICLPFAVLIPSLSRVLFLEIQSISTLYFPMIPFHFYNLRVLFLVPTTNSLQCAMGIISYSHSQGSPLSSCVLSRVLSPNLITNKITILLLGRTS